MALLTLLLVGCGEDRTLAPDKQHAEEPSFMERCELWPEGCPGDIDPDPEPAALGYYMGALTTPANCFNANGTNINDPDWDGMDNGCEQRLADKFRPALSLAPSNYDCDPTPEPYWAAKYFPAGGNMVRIAYLMAYHRDCGDRSLGSGLLQKVGILLTLNGFIEGAFRSFNLSISTDDPGDSHAGDSEWIMVNLRYNISTKHWYVSSMKTSAHYGTAADGTRETSTGGIQVPAGSVAGGFPRVWVAAKKHANYPSRAACNTGRGPFGAAKDNCDSNIPDTRRVYFHYLRNVGSMRGNLINLGTCVKSEQPLFYPGTECFWKQNDYFYGWLQYPYGHPPTPYYEQLIMEFECRSFATESTGDRRCSDFGVHRPH
jgi:hypothetical protein